MTIGSEGCPAVRGALSFFYLFKLRLYSSGLGMWHDASNG
nr:MAG TPA: hypothetical protein [Caudoviricetes sp.]